MLTDSSPYVPLFDSRTPYLLTRREGGLDLQVACIPRALHTPWKIVGAMPREWLPCASSGGVLLIVCVAMTMVARASREEAQHAVWFMDAMSS